MEREEASDMQLRRDTGYAADSRGGGLTALDSAIPCGCSRISSLRCRSICPPIFSAIVHRKTGDSCARLRPLCTLLALEEGRAGIGGLRVGIGLGQR